MIDGTSTSTIGKRFDSKHPYSYYRHKIIGGNNSRVALQEILQEHPREKWSQTCLISV